MPGSLLVLKMLQTLVKIFITGASQTETHEGCRWTPFSLQIHVDHAFFEDTKVLFRSILHRCENLVFVNKKVVTFLCFTFRTVDTLRHLSPPQLTACGSLAQSQGQQQCKKSGG